MKRITISVLLAAGFVAASVAAVSTANVVHASNDVSHGVRHAAAATSAFEIINQNSGKCLTESGAGGNGTAITQVACNGSAYQFWQVDPFAGSGSIVNQQYGSCLDLWGNNNADGQTVFTWGCYNGPSQQWEAINVGGSLWELHPTYTGKCLDVQDGFTNDGTIIQQWGCHGASNQHWYLVG